MAVRRHIAGFTLLELMLLLLVIALVSAIAAPQLSGFAKGRVLPNTATEFIIATRWARTQAISDGVAYRLNINVEGRQWWVTKDDGTGTDTFVAVAGEFGAPFQIPEGMTIQTDITAVDGVVYVQFQPSGRSDVGSFQFMMDGRTVTVLCDTPLATYHLQEAQG